MATHVQSDLQTKIYDILTGDATLMALVSDRIYDHVPDNTDYPYDNQHDNQPQFYNKIPENYTHLSILPLVS